MKRDLTWWDLAWFGVGAVIGAGIFVLTGQEAKEVVGPAVVISYVVSGVSAMLSVFCYTEFAVEIPVAGGSFAYLRVELGDFMAFVAAGNILLEYCIGSAAVARAWTSYFATLLNHQPAQFRIHASSLAADYSELDPIAVVVITLICAFAVVSTKGSSRFNYVLSIVHIAVILFIIVAGLTKADTANMRDFMPYGPRGIFAASAVLFFAYIGFDAVSTMAEETKDPARDIPIGLVGSMAITTALYCVLAVVLCLMQPYGDIDKDAPFSVAFAARGMDWAKYIVAFGALKGMTTVLLVSAVGQARYLTHIARTHMMPPWLAEVHPRTGTPVNATVVMLFATAVIAFFTDLAILSNLLSISTLFIFMLVAVALLVRRYYVAGEAKGKPSTRDGRRPRHLFRPVLLHPHQTGLRSQLRPLHQGVGEGGDGGEGQEDVGGEGGGGGRVHQPDCERAAPVQDHGDHRPGHGAAAGWRAGHRPRRRGARLRHAGLDCRGWDECNQGWLHKVHS